MVIVARMATDIDHAIDRGRATPALAARPVELSAVHVLLGLGVEAPIVIVCLLDEAADARRHPHHQGIVLLAGLDQADLDRRISRQAVCQCAPSATRADDDVIISFHGYLAPACFGNTL